MGNLRKIRKDLNKSICLAKTGLVFGGSKVCLIVDDPIEGKVKAEAYRQYTFAMAHRASLVNVSDIMNVSLVLRDRMLNGKPIWN